MLISSSGLSVALPPPLPPPLIPKIGPRDGSLRFATALNPIFDKACVNPIDVVVFPSPAGVGVIPVTKINLPDCLPSPMASV